MNQTRPLFQSLFEDNLHLLSNPACQQCDPDIKYPLMPWLVGEKFSSTQERLVFVGKPHRGIPGEILPSGILDPTADVEGDKGLWNEGWAYWSYTREIAERLYGDDAFESISFTNLVKCTNTDGPDATTWTMARNCIVELGVIWREFEVIKPLTAVFYTYSLYRDLLLDIPIAIQDTITEITSPEHRVTCGQKTLGWWERACATSWARRMRVLVIGHPERMKRDDYTNLLVDWIRPGTPTDGDF